MWFSARRRATGGDQMKSRRPRHISVPKQLHTLQATLDIVRLDIFFNTPILFKLRSKKKFIDKRMSFVQEKYNIVTKENLTIII